MRNESANDDEENDIDTAKILVYNFPLYPFDYSLSILNEIRAIVCSFSKTSYFRPRVLTNFKLQHWQVSIYINHFPNKMICLHILTMLSMIFF